MGTGNRAGSTGLQPTDTGIATVAALTADRSRAGGGVCAIAAITGASTGPTITTGSTDPRMPSENPRPAPTHRHHRRPGPANTTHTATATIGAIQTQIGTVNTTATVPTDSPVPPSPPAPPAPP
ncbi:hypothetical protein MMRN_27330 [Mycobacterium marinum]|nr:hypothetical protein MMRN_27330 [Mycobacterium marinum]